MSLESAQSAAAPELDQAKRQKMAQQNAEAVIDSQTPAPKAETPVDGAVANETSEPPAEQRVESTGETTAEAGPNLDQDFVNPDELLKSVGERMAANASRIEELRKTVASDQEKLKDVRAQLGLSPEAGAESAGNATELERLEAEQERLEKEQVEARDKKQLEETLELLAQLPKTELTVIIQTGRGPDGQQLKTPDGRPITPDTAKKLAEAAESGAKKLTKGILGIILAIVKGVMGGIFESADKTVQGK